MVTIDGRVVGPGEPCFVIAEAGVNHDGDVDLAHSLVDAAARTGADAIKFQAFRADELAAPEAAKAPYQAETTNDGGTQLDMLRALELEPAAFAELKRHAEEVGLVFLSSAFDAESAAELNRIGIAAFKIGSGDLTNHLLLRDVGRYGRPVILSSGASTLDEVEAAVAVLRDAGTRDIVVLHCVSAYPAAIEDANLRALTTLADRLGLPVGYSDHTEGDEAALAAVALGACVLEKHLTLDRTLAGPDHRTSLEPDELRTLVARVRRVESALGDGDKRRTAAEEANAKVVRRSLAARADLPEGAVLASAMLTALRPGTGIPPSRLDEVIGRRLRRAVARHELLDPEDLE